MKALHIVKRDRTDASANLDQQMSVRNVAQLAHFPPANSARFPLKDENRIIVIKPSVALLRWGQTAAHTGRDDNTLLANQSVRLQSTPNVLIEPLNFVQ